MTDEDWEGVPPEIVMMDQIMDDPMNPNVMDGKQLKALEFSMEKEKNVVPIIVNRVKNLEKPYMVVNGHQRLKILRKRKIEKVLSVIIEKPIIEAREFGLGLNRNVGQDDPEKLSNLFRSFHDADQIRMMPSFVPQFDHDFTSLSIDKFHHLGLSDDIEDKSGVLAIPESTTTKTGDKYQLGKHTIMCGESTNAKHVNDLLGKVKIDQINTDPPYGVDYQGKNSFLHKVRPNSKRIQFESEAVGAIKDYTKFFKSFLELVPMAEINTVYIFMAGLRLHELRMAFEEAGFTWSDYLVWVKNHFVFGRKDHKAKHENILYGWKGKHKFYGDAATSTIYFQDRPQVSEDHPTKKPVELVSRLILEGTKKDAIVYDPFGGSGTCVIACENNDRVCYSMEKIPFYIDVIINRWQALTKKKAVKL